MARGHGDPPRFLWRRDDKADRQCPAADRLRRRERHLAPQTPLHGDRAPRPAAGLAGASVFRGIEGFGASSLIHTSRLLSLSEDLPVAIVVVDTEDGAGLPAELDELVDEGMVILDPARSSGTSAGSDRTVRTGEKGKK